MKAKDIFELFEKKGLKLETERQWGYDGYRSRTDISNAIYVSVLNTVKLSESGIYSGYDIGFVADKDGHVFALYASWIYQDDGSRMREYHSVTYVVGIKPMKVRLYHYFGAYEVIGEPPLERKAWKESTSSEMVDLPTLEPELAKKFLDAMRKSIDFSKLSNGKPIVFPDLSEVA
jgi:hypothetical protein